MVSDAPNAVLAPEPLPVPESTPAAEAPASPARSGLRKGLLALFDQAVVSGTLFATTVVIGRLGSQEELGVYSLALALVMFIRCIQLELVCSPYTVYCQRRQGADLLGYTGSTLAHFLLLTLVSVVFLLGVGLALSLGLGPASAAGTVWVLAGMAPFVLLREYIRQLSLAHLRLTLVLAVDVVVAVLQLGGLLLLWRLGSLTSAAAYAVMGAACGVACLAWLLGRVQPLRLERARLLADWKHNWGFGRWAAASFLVCNGTSFLMPWVVALTHGEAVTGLLAACTTLIGIANMYVTGVGNFLTPRAARAFAEGGQRELFQLLRKTGLLFLGSLGTFALLILVLGDLPTRLVYGDRYNGTAGVLTLLALNTLFMSLGLTAGNGLWAMERPQANFVADVCCLVITLAGTLALVGPLGAMGAALAILAGTACGTAVRCWTLLRIGRIVLQ